MWRRASAYRTRPHTQRAREGALTGLSFPLFLFLLLLLLLYRLLSPIGRLSKSRRERVGGGGGSPLAPTATATTPLLWSTLNPHRRMITIKGKKRYLRSSGFLLSIVFSDATCDIFLPLLCWLARWEGLDRRGRPSALEHRPSPPPPCP